MPDFLATQGVRTVVSEQRQMAGNMISLMDHRLFSDSFKPVYIRGMDMVEEAACYMDGEGREQARNLSRLAAELYAQESMRLTTRLMQIASWLLLQRAARNGEMPPQKIAAEKAKVRLDTPSAGEGVPGWNELPETFTGLVERSMQLQAQIIRMEMNSCDRIDTTNDAANGNPVSDQIVLLKTAFGAS